VFNDYRQVPTEQGDQNDQGMLFFLAHERNPSRALSTAVDQLSQAQRERLAYLEMRAYFTGELRRADIEARFGIKPAASSRDLRAYRELEPDNLDYDVAARCYRPTLRFKPIFEFSTDRILAWLLQGFGDGLELRLRRIAPCEGPGNLVRPNLSILSTITRAMCASRAVRVSYLSLTSGMTKREVVPVALADNGLRWHVRAFDRQRARFADFVLTRIAKAEELDGTVSEHELLSSDEQWSRVVDLELVPHPGLKQPRAVEADFAMHDGVLRVKARAALAGYVLRRWSVDASPDHHLDPAAHQLWLRNTPTLYGVESAAIAPGLDTSASERVSA
jgi:hypothetical protein